MSIGGKERQELLFSMKGEKREKERGKGEKKGKGEEWEGRREKRGNFKKCLKFCSLLTWHPRVPMLTMVCVNR